MAEAAKLKLDDLPELLTLRETANFFRVSLLTIKRWGSQGKLKPILINSRGDRRYPKTTVLSFLEIANEEKKCQTS